MLHLPKNGISNIEFLVNVNYVRNLHCILALFLTASIASGPRSDFFFFLLGISLCVNSYRIILYHIISYRVKSHHVRLYHVILCVSFHIMPFSKVTVSYIWSVSSDCQQRLSVQPTVSSDW